VKLAVPVPLRIGALVLGATGLYTYIGQLVPQKQVLPPQETRMKAEMTVEDLVVVGHEIAMGKGLCFTCHTLGKSGALRFPDLQGIGERAGSRIEGMGGLEYLSRSIYDPESYIVPGFNPGMPEIDRPPIGLSDQEILAVIAYLQSLGGEPTVTLATTKADLGLE
jgi:mono/diheme cytochrome c family protein